MDTLLDVLRALADAAFRTGGIGGDVHQAIHEVINAHDSGHQAEVARAAEFSPADQAELERLQAKAAAAAAEPPEPAAVPASPLLTPGGAPE